MFEKSHVNRLPEKALCTQVRNIYPPGCPHSSFNDVASVTANIVAPFDLTEKHDVGRGRRRKRGKPGLVSRHYAKLKFCVKGTMVPRQGSGKYSKKRQKRQLSRRGGQYLSCYGLGILQGLLKGNRLSTQGLDLCLLEVSQTPAGSISFSVCLLQILQTKKTLMHLSIASFHTQSCQGFGVHTAMRGSEWQDSIKASTCVHLPRQHYHGR